MISEIQYFESRFIVLYIGRRINSKFQISVLCEDGQTTAKWKSKLQYSDFDIDKCVFMPFRAFGFGHFLCSLFCCSLFWRSFRASILCV